MESFKLGIVFGAVILLILAGPIIIAFFEFIFGNLFVVGIIIVGLFVFFVFNKKLSSVGGGSGDTISIQP
jgi:hypothetical protein